MYDTRWPRPGPAMAAVAAVVGLVAGAFLGVSSPASAPRAQARPPAETAAEPTTSTLPDSFFTVILGSFEQRDGADRRLRLVRGQGVRDARLLDRERYVIRTRWAVFSGVFRTEPEAEAHEEQLSQLGIAERYVKSVKRAT